MRIVIEIPETKYLSLKKCLENGITLGMTDIAVLNGTLLPEGAEILTKEAYSDLCLRASQEPILDKIEKEINSPNRGTCDYFIVDRIEEIIGKYKAEIKEGAEE